MPTLDLSNPGQLLSLAAAAVVAFVLLALLYRELRVRSRRYGGGDAAALVMLLAVIVLLVVITPDVLPVEVAFGVMVAAIAVIFRPEYAVRFTGGPSLAWRTLREGRSLRLSVREAGGPVQAAADEAIVARIAALDTLDGRGTSVYISCLKAVLLEDPAAPGHAAREAALDTADAELRASLGGRPTWERELEARAAALDGGSISD